MRAVTYLCLILLCAGCEPSTTESNDALGISAPSDVPATAAVESTSDAPFGIEFGIPASSVRGATQIEPGLFETKTPPKTHPDFESVALIAYPETGVCVIRAIGKDIDNDSAGVSIRSKTRELAEALATKYGSYEETDSCLGSDISCQEQFWMMSLNNGERYYGFKWPKQNDLMKRLGIESVYVAARGSDISTAYPVLEFHSDKTAACEKAEKSLSAAAL